MPKSLQGHFLISGKRLQDPNFCRSVVLMVQHDEDGAMGLIVNRPSSVSVAHALSEHFNLPETEDLVYVGDPVEPAALFILHNAGELDQSEAPVIPGVYVGSSAEVFETVVRQAAQCAGDLRFRIYSGCAGWAPGQLESELARGDWYIIPATADLVLHDDPYQVWDEAMKRVYKANRVLPQTCEHPEWN